MKLTKSKLKQLIKEELAKVLKEGEGRQLARDIETVVVPIKAFEGSVIKPTYFQPDPPSTVEAYMKEAEHHDLEAEIAGTDIIFRGSETNMQAFRDAIDDMYVRTTTPSGPAWVYISAGPKIPWAEQPRAGGRQPHPRSYDRYDRY